MSISNSVHQVDTRVDEETTPASTVSQLDVQSAVPIRLQMSGLSGIESPLATPSSSSQPNAEVSARSDMSLTDSDDTPMALSP